MHWTVFSRGSPGSCRRQPGRRTILAYAQAKNFSKTPEKMGTGVAEGLIASESSNNGLTRGALIPLLSLGIPGDAATAVLISAFMLQGIQVGHGPCCYLALSDIFLEKSGSRRPAI